MKPYNLKRLKNILLSKEFIFTFLLTYHRKKVDIQFFDNAVTEKKLPLTFTNEKTTINPRGCIKKIF